MRAKRLVAGALAGAVALTVVGGCAAQQAQALEPKLELRAAAQQLAAAQQAAFSLKLTGTPDDLIAAVKLEAAKDKSGDQPDAQDEAILRKLFTSSLTIAYDKAGAGAADDRSAIAADIDGITGTELRYLDGVLYAKAPVNDLAAKFGASPADLKALSTNVAGKVAGVDDFLAGKWVSLDVKKLTELAGAGAGLPTETLDQQKAAAELTRSAANLLDGATVVRDSADSTHLVVTSSTAKAAAEAKRFAAAVSPELAGSLPEEPKATPDRPVVLDLWVNGGTFTAAEINLLQFIDGATGRVAVRVEASTGTPITAPAGATAIDLTSLAPKPRTA